MQKIKTQQFAKFFLKDLKIKESNNQNEKSESVELNSTSTS